MSRGLVVIAAKCQFMDLCPSAVQRLITSYFETTTCWSRPQWYFNELRIVACWKIIAITHLCYSVRWVSAGHCTIHYVDHHLLLFLGNFGGFYCIDGARLSFITTTFGGSMLTLELPWTVYIFARMLQERIINLD